MSSTRLDPAELRRIAGEFDKERLEIERQLATIRHWVDTTRPAWTGKAGLGYQSANEMWGAQQESLLRLLHEVADLCRVHASESEAATDQATDTFMKLPL